MIINHFKIFAITLKRNFHFQFKVGKESLNERKTNNNMQVEGNMQTIENINFISKIIDHLRRKFCYYIGENFHSQPKVGRESCFVL
jgi:hypothetical protein